MMNKIAKKITDYFIRKKTIDSNDRDAYDYSFEIALATIMNGLAIIIIAIATMTYLESLLYTISFLLLRGVAGGYHAKTHLGCFLMLMFFYGLFILLLKMVNIQILNHIAIFYMIATFILVFSFAPVESPNNPFSKEKKLKLARESIILCVVVILISIVLICLLPHSPLSFSLLSGAMSVSISLPLAVFTKKSEK